jgi:ribose 5-phosphate isomerase B
MRIGIAADHGGFELKTQLTPALKAAGHDVVDFGAHELVVGDDYPDFVVPLARAMATGEVTRGVAICGSGVGACVVETTATKRGFATVASAGMRGIRFGLSGAEPS